MQEGVAAIPGGDLDPDSVPKYVTTMLIPPQMPRAGILFERGQLIDYVEIALRQFSRQILPQGFGASTVWGYGPAEALSPLAPIIFNPPSLTIEANAGAPVRIKWINQLTKANGLSGYATVGTWYDFFAAKAKSKYCVTWRPGFGVFQYPKDQRASAIWYHDHTLGMTGGSCHPLGCSVWRRNGTAERSSSARCSVCCTPTRCAFHRSRCIRSRPPMHAFRQRSTKPRARLACRAGGC